MQVCATVHLEYPRTCPPAHRPWGSMATALEEALELLSPSLNDEEQTVFSEAFLSESGSM